MTLTPSDTVKVAAHTDLINGNVLAAVERCAVAGVPLTFPVEAMRELHSLLLRDAALPPEGSDGGSDLPNEIWAALHRWRIAHRQWNATEGGPSYRASARTALNAAIADVDRAIFGLRDAALPPAGSARERVLEEALRGLIAAVEARNESDGTEHDMALDAARAAALPPAGAGERCPETCFPDGAGRCALLKGHAGRHVLDAGETTERAFKPPLGLWEVWGTIYEGNAVGLPALVVGRYGTFADADRAAADLNAAALPPAGGDQ